MKVSQITVRVEILLFSVLSKLSFDANVAQKTEKDSSISTRAHIY